MPPRTEEQFNALASKLKDEILAHLRDSKPFTRSEIVAQNRNDGFKMELTSKMKNKIIKELQEFTKLYFKKNPPAVKWKKMEANGMADRENNIIYLNPDIPLKKSLSIEIGDGISYKPKTRLKFSDSEKFFKVLIHEIGHFKRRLKPQREYYSIRNRLRKMYPNDIKTQYMYADSVIEIKNNESTEDYTVRIEDFRCWFKNGWTMAEHVEVENWSTEEFKKQRKKIKEIIKRWQ